MASLLVDEMAVFAAATTTEKTLHPSAQAGAGVSGSRLSPRGNMMTARRMPQTPAAVDYRLLGRQVSADMHTGAVRVISETS